jgi:hypothetical protein
MAPISSIDGTVAGRRGAAREPGYDLAMRLPVTLPVLSGPLALGLLMACDGDAGTGETGDPTTEFCSTLDDGNTYEDYGSAEVGAGSGSLNARVITDQSEEVRDPFYVAYRPYTLEPVETGGVQTKGSTTGDGLVEKTLGVGNWDFEVTWTRGSTTCVAAMQFPILEQQTTRVCVVMTCPE